MFKKAVEYFIPAQAGHSNEYQRRLRLVAYTIFVTAIFSLFYVSVSYTAGFLRGITVMGCSFLGYIIILLLLKNRLNVIVAANLFVGVGALSIYACIYFSGGFIAPPLPWLASTPIVTLLIAGKKSGYVWAGVSVIVMLVFGLMHFNGYSFPKLYNESKTAYFYLSSYTGLILIIFLISIVFENVRISAFNQLSKQKDEVQEALIELKAAQAQLIHAEKMASLGELTAGIAHEIQNPLNFVNNFSEVSAELLQELREELIAGNTADTLALADDIILNLQRITEHGKRADAIVKGMLQHSRTNTGKKEPTDINALADEFLRLSYHGLRAKDKSFNSDFKTNFDAAIGKINIVPQDIGRVFLNLCNNAFYAVNEKKQQAPEAYKPMVWLSTLQADNKIVITVKDNGNGIPKSVLDKIYQPFFTTKPAGQGTGLGLSLSYDIIKAHGGELKSDTKEREGTAFIITLPV